MEETQVGGDKRVKLGVPGLDSIFPDGLRAGSLIVIIGPPGAGKTLLAMQLLMEIHSLSDGKAPPSLYCTSDEAVKIIDEETKRILPDLKECPSHVTGYPSFANLGTFVQEAWNSLMSGLAARGDIKSAEEFPVPPDPVAGKVNRNGALDILCKKLSEVYSSSGRFGSVAIDGILNLPEVRGLSPDERRDALFELAGLLRSLVQSSPAPSAVAILTLEASGTPDVIGVEEYLADVVIHLRVDAPIKGKRRRVLEVTKARYAGPILGEHSLWIMSDKEVTRRYKTNATLGWSKQTLSQAIRRGIVVFPRMRWQARPGADRAAMVEQLLLQLREIVSAIPTGHHNLLKDRRLVRIVEQIAMESDPSPDELRDLAASLAPLLDWIGKLTKDKFPLIPRGRSSSESGEGSTWTLTETQALAAKINSLLGAQASEKSSEVASHSGIPAFADRGSVCSFGTPGLDALFAADGDGGRDGGVPRRSSTAVIGAPGVGKSTIAYLFTLAGLLADENVIFVAFDVRGRRMVQQARRLSIEDGNGGLIFSEQFARQAILGDSDETGPRLKLIYEHPVNMDLNELMHLLTLEVKQLTSRDRHCRIIFDGVAELGRNTADPLVFNDLLATLLNSASDWRATLLLTYEDASTATDEPCDATVARLADNVIALRHVQVNNANRKCVWIQKVRGRPHSSAVAELTYWNRGGLSGVSVRRGFEGMSKVLSGHPQPAQIELRLFYENDSEKICNERFCEDVIERFGDRVRHVPFTLSGARRTYWHRQEGRDIRPDADVTVLSVDEPWVQSFLAPARGEGTSLAWWDPRDADVGQRFLVAQLIPSLRNTVCEDADPSPDSRLLALPHYLDLGLLLHRTDYKLHRYPTHWTDAASAMGDESGTSFEAVVGLASRNSGVPGFSFNMESSETTCCTFLEMCWNFGAAHDFLLEEDDHSIHAAIAALSFLARLRWANVLPFPCTLEHCANAIFTRAWYANVATLAKIAPHKSWRPIPFFTASAAEAPLMEVLSKRVDRLKAKAVDDHAKSGAEIASYADHLVKRNSGWEAGCREAQKQRRDAVNRERNRPTGVSCSGAWYLGVVTAGGNSNLGWSVVQEALNPRRIEERAFLGGGLPPTLPFYRDYAERPIPFLADMTFGRITQSLLGWTRRRESALGIGIQTDLPQGVYDASREIPEIIHSMVMNVLSDPLSSSTLRGHDRAVRFIAREVQAMFDRVRSLIGPREPRRRRKTLRRANPVRSAQPPVA